MGKIRAFTDGACSGNPGPGGWGSIIYASTFNHQLSGRSLETTNNRMELTAVVETLNYLIQHGMSGEELEIHSDSAYVVNGINKGWIYSWMKKGWLTSKGEDVKNKDLWLRLISYIGQFTTINLIKVKGHSGHIQNDAVDLLAKQQSSMAKKEEALWT
jgi:ribonuclease HI